MIGGWQKVFQREQLVFLVKHMKIILSTLEHNVIGNIMIKLSSCLNIKIPLFNGLPQILVLSIKMILIKISNFHLKKFIEAKMKVIK